MEPLVEAVEVVTVEVYNVVVLDSTEDKTIKVASEEAVVSTEGVIDVYPVEVLAIYR